MGINERREREKEYRRNMIVDAAEKVFFSKGFDHATMDDVAETSELSKGTLYLYFKNKDDLWHAIQLRGMKILHEEFQKALTIGGNGMCKVRKIGETYYNYAQSYPNYFHAMMTSDYAKIDMDDKQSYGFQCHACSENVMDTVASALQEGIDDSSIRPNVHPMKTAYLLWGQMTGVIQVVAMGKKGNHMKSHHNVDPDELLPEVFDFVAHALQNK
ncbi:MAG: TetR/AcrR family transcriptional regulator [Calditrichia bacterium]